MRQDDSRRVGKERRKLVEQLMEAGQELGTLEVLFHTLIAERSGLGATDHKALLLLAQEGSMTAGQLAERTGLTTGSVTALIDRLESGGYADRVRDTEDRRRVLVRPRVEDARRRIAPLFKDLGCALSDLYGQYRVEELRLLLDYKIRLSAILRDCAQRLRNERE